METVNENYNKLNSPFSVIDFLLYFGGFSFFLGLSYLVLDSWENLGTFLQILLTFGVAIILLCIGTYLVYKFDLRKLGLPLIFISIFLLPVGLNILVNKLFYFIDLSDYFLIAAMIFLFCAMIFLLSNLFVRSALLTFFILMFFQAFYFFFIINFSQNYNLNIFSDIYYFALIVLGLSGIILSKYFYDKDKFFYNFLSFFSINYILFGMWFFGFFLNENNVDSEPYRLAFFPIFVLSLIYYAVKNNDSLIKIFSVIYLIFYLIYMFFKFVNYEYFVSTILIILGLSLIIFGFYYYLKDSIKNRNIKS